MEITLIGVFLALLITAAIMFAYSLGKTVGQDISFKEGFDQANYIHELRNRDQNAGEVEADFFFDPEDEELWD